MVGTRPLLVSCPSWLASMCEVTIWLTVLFCFYLLQFICSCESLYENKVWGQTMGAFPVSPCQGFNFHTIKCFHQWPSAHSFNSQTYPRSYCWGWGWGTRARPRWKQTQIEKQGGRGSSATRSLPTNMWTKTFKKSACTSLPSFNRHALFWSSEC